MNGQSIALPAPPSMLLRILLIVIAAVETLSALSNLPAIFFEYEQPTRLLVFAQWLIKARLALAPFFAGAALVFAIRGQVRHAIVALAGLMLLIWLTEVPSFFIHGLEFSGGILGLLVFVQRFVYPAIAVATIVLAVKSTRLVVAGILVSVPTVIAVASLIAFAIAILIYGF